MGRNIFQIGMDYLRGTKEERNVYNQAFLQFIGLGYVQYDAKNKTYLEKGYNDNPTVFSIINKQTVKTVSVPYSIKEIEDKQSYAKLNQLDLATKGTFSIQQHIKRQKLQIKAYKAEEKPFPLENPNPNQTWSDIIGLFKTYMKITGNYYQYSLSPQDGINKAADGVTTIEEILRITYE